MIDRPNFDEPFGLTTNPLRLVYMMGVVWLLARRGRTRLDVLEVGSWCGASGLALGEAIAQHMSGGTITCVDPWQPYTDLGADPDNLHLMMNELLETRDIFDVFRANMKFLPASVALNVRAAIARLFYRRSRRKVTTSFISTAIIAMKRCAPILPMQLRFCATGASCAATTLKRNCTIATERVWKTEQGLSACGTRKRIRFSIPALRALSVKPSVRSHAGTDSGRCKRPAMAGAASLSMVCPGISQAIFPPKA